MGHSFLQGRTWAEITREERFFTQHLFALIQRAGARSFVEFLNSTRSLDLPPTANWEIAYEVCLYRDLWFLRDKQGQPVSPKRTFDLCLLSDQAIILIEAKAQQDFDLDQISQLRSDRHSVAEETGVKRVLLLGLASSHCAPSPAVTKVFDAPLLTWLELARRYGGDPILLRADHIYEAGTWASSGKNNEGGHMTGLEMVDAYRAGKRFFVGRSGGINGPLLEKDVASGAWKTQRYETNATATVAPNRNWFSLEEFIRKVRVI